MSEIEAVRSAQVRASMQHSLFGGGGLMMLTRHSDPALRDILKAARTIAVVGHSDKPNKPSYQIANYLRRAGYKVYPVNPTVKTIDGEPSYPSLADVPEPIDIVDVFRNSRHLPEVVEEAIAVGAKVVWAQLGVSSEQAERRAAEAGMTLIENNCIKVTHMYLMR
jgi:predicted CoA-binding protein